MEVIWRWRKNKVVGETAVVRGRKMEEGRGEGAPYMFLLMSFFIAIIFMRLFLCGCFIFIFMLFY